MKPTLHPTRCLHAAVIAAALGLVVPVAARAADTDRDGVPDHVETTLGMDPQFADTLELVYEDGAMDDGDRNFGPELSPDWDFTNIYFCPIAQSRYMWKIEFAAEVQWPPAGHDVTILYLDADNDRNTGRRDKQWAYGTDLMLRPTRGAQRIEWPSRVPTVACAHANSLYIVADVSLNQDEDNSVYRMTFLYQDTRDGHQQRRDSMPWIEVTGAGASDRAPVSVPQAHPLYRPPEVITDVAARVPFGDGEPSAEITFITSWPCRARVQYGTTREYGSEVADQTAANNHRLYIRDLVQGQEYHWRVLAPGFTGQLHKTEDAAIVARRPTAPPGAARRETVVLTLRGPADVAPDNCPFTLGLPFASGLLRSDDHIRLLVDGSEIPLQSEVTARWPDGSVKWVLLDFLTDVPAGGTAKCTLEYGSQVRRQPVDEGISISRDEQRLTVDTGRLRVSFNPEHGGPFKSACLDADGNGTYADDENILGRQFSPGIGLTDAEGRHLDAIYDTPDIDIERPGPLHAIIKVTGTHADNAGNRMFDYISRYHFFAGSGLVKLQHTVGNDRVQQTLTRIDWYGIGIPLSFGAEALVTVEGAAEGPIQKIAKEGNVELTQDLDNHWSLAEPAGLHEGERGPQAIDVTNGRLGLWVGLRHFWQKWPSQLTFNPDAMGIGVNLLPAFPEDKYAQLGDAAESDRLYYHLRDGGYKLHRGVSFTREVWLGFHGNGDRHTKRWAAALHEPPVAHAPPHWYCNSGAFGEQLPRENGRFDRYEAMVERGFAELITRREANRAYGFLNFGDWWGERGYNWGNVEYDTQHGLMMQFIRTGDPKFLRNACYAAAHNRDVDFVHYAQRPQDVGKTRPHCMFHTGGYEPRMAGDHLGLAYPNVGLTNPLSGHQWTRGLFEHYFMTGRRRSLQTALALSDIMAGPYTVGWTIGHHAERDTSWAIEAVMAAYEATYDPFYLNAAKIQIADVLRKQDPETGNWGFPAGYSDVEPNPVGGYAWCCGLLISALERYNRYAQDPQVDTAILRAAQWLMRDEYIPRRKGFRACSCETFNERTRAGQSCWSVSNALAHAYELSGDERYLDIAHMCFSYYALGGAGIGKTYSQALCTSPHLIYKLHRAGRDDLDTVRWAELFEIRAPRVFLLGEDRVLPLLARTARKHPVEAQVRVVGRPPRPATLQPGGQWQFIRLGGVQPGRVTLHVSAADTIQKLQVQVLEPNGPPEPGDGVGLIAGEEDYLGPALDELGVQFERLQTCHDLRRVRIAFFGTQACTLDAGGIRSHPEPLLRWLHSGGTAIFSQLNDRGWDPFLLGQPLVVQEQDTESGNIAAPHHPIFDQPNRLSDLSGAKMYDSIGYVAAPWNVLLTDANARPAILECRLGKGRAIIIQPSFERYVTGELEADSAQTLGAFRGLLENLVAHVE